VLLLACLQPLLGQIPPISYGISIGISEFDDVQIPKVLGADSSADLVGNALRGIGLAQRNVQVRTNRDANTDAVRRALRTVLKDRATAMDSVLVFITGNGRVDTASGAREAYLMTFDSNPGAKRTTAFRLSELGQLIKASQAAGIYLIIDLTGDPLQPELENLAKTPRVVLSAVSSSSILGLGASVARVLSETKQFSSVTAGQLLDQVKTANPSRQAYLGAQQPGAVLFPAKALVAEGKPPLVEPVKPSGAPAGVEDKPIPGPAPNIPQPVQQTVNTDAQTRANNLQAAITRARAAARQEKWVDALTAIADALKIDAQSSEAKDLLWSVSRSQLTAMVRAHQWDEVKKILDRCIRMGPSDSQLQEFLRDAMTMINAEGLNSSRQSKWEEAATEFKLCLSIKDNPEASNGLALADLHTLYNAGVLAFNNHQYGEARDKFKAVQKLETRFNSSADQTNLAPLFADAQVKFKQSNTELVLQGATDQFNRGEYTTSQATVDEILKTDPGNPGAKILQRRLSRTEDIDQAISSGQASLTNHDWQGALQDFEMALRMNEHDTRAKSGRQQAQAALDQRKRNIMVASAGIGIPASILLIILAPSARRARVYARFGWADRSAHLLEKILERNPGRVDAVISLSALYSNSGRRPSAVNLCTQYLVMKPGDLRVLLLLAGNHFELRDFDNARRVYQQILALDSSNSIACSRLLEMEDFPGGEDAGALQVYEPALHANPNNVELNRLVAHCYMRQGRQSPEALGIFNQALTTDGGNFALQLAAAEACWKQGLFEEVIVHAGKAIGQDTEHRRALFLWLGASKKCGKLAECFALVDSGKASGLRAISVCEEIVALDPALRPMVHERYERFLESVPSSAECELYSSHIGIDTGSTALALNHLKVALSADSPTSTEALYKLELARALSRFRESHRAKEDYPQAYADVLFRLGELYRGRDPRSALATFKEIVKLPEWQVRSTAALEDIMDGLRVDELAAFFFEDVEWDACPDGARTGGFSDLAVNPPSSSESKLHSMFGNCKVRCFGRPITLDDVVQLNRELADQAAVNREFTFVVSPLRARQDVLALIFALLTEQPSLRVIPLEAVSLKQAIIESKCADTLEQLLRLWVGQGDLFDVHSPIADAGTFFGRGQFIHTLTTKIIHRENFGIFGLRKVGKTSLVFQLRENLPRNLIGYTDLQSISSRRCDEIYFRLSAAVRRELRVKFPEVPAIPSRLTDFDSSRTYPSIATDFHNELLKIKEALESQGQQPRVLLLLDEIELLLPSEQSKGFIGFEDFFRQIRGLYQQEGFILSGVVGADPNACRAGKWGDRDNPIFQYYDEIFLSPLDRSECDQMVQGIGEVMGISFDSNSLASIYEESGGHPYVGRQLCSRIVSRHNQRPLRITREAVDEGVEDYIAQRPDYFIGVFRGYISTESRKLLEMTAANDENDVSRAELLAFSVKAGLERSSFDRALQDLELFHLLSREKDRYHIKIRLMRRWIRRSWLGIE
jgi:tetratricopeptide (TPR) repeat protein